MSTTYSKMTTAQLREGMVVMTHGMRCLIDKDINEGKHGSRPVVYWTIALVLNREDVGDRVVPRSWTHEYGLDYGNAGEHRWVIQGNEHAWWHVEDSDGVLTDATQG